jgi:hypothetical protein
MRNERNKEKVAEFFTNSTKMLAEIYLINQNSKFSWKNFRTKNSIK